MSICVDLRLSSADLPVCGRHRRVPSRTLLFFCSIFEALNFWTRLRWVTLLRRRLAIVDGSASIVRLSLRRWRPTSKKATDFHIDKRWDSRLSALVQKVLHVETELWRLSTLGGAVSAMGFFSRKFIRHAFVISIRQLRLAIQIGDPVLISRCFLYISLAFAQKGQFLPALKIVRQEWNRGIELRSDFLLNCTRGVWSTIKWLMMNRKMMMLK